MRKPIRLPGVFAAALFTVCSISISPAGMPDGWRYENIFPSGANLHASWAAAQDNVFFGGEGGTILRWDGAHWEEMETPTQKTIKAIHGTGPTDVWAVGGDDHAIEDAERPLMMHFDGTTWSEVTPPTYAGSNFRFAAVHAVAADDVWAVTVVGSWIAHWDGTSWEFLNFSTGLAALSLYGNFYAITSAGPDHVYFCGTHGQIVHRDGATWTLERQTETGSFSVNLNFAIWASDADNVFVGDNYGEVYKRNPADGSWITLGLADSQNIQGIWGRSASEIYVVSGDYLRVLDGSSQSATKISYTGKLRGFWKGATGAGSRLFAAGDSGTVHEISLEAGDEFSLSPLTVGGGSALTLPKNRESRLTGATAIGNSGNFLVYGDTRSRPGAHPIYRFDGSEFHSSPFGDSNPERLMDPGVWVMAAVDLPASGPLIAFESLFQSPLAGGVHWRRPSGWVEVKNSSGIRLRAIGAMWKAPDDTDPDASIVYAIKNYQFTRSEQLLRIRLPHAELSPPTWEVVHTLPAEIPQSTSFSCLWGRSSEEIYFGTSEGEVFRWNGSDATAETTPSTVDPLRAICGDSQGEVYAVGENSLAMRRLPTGSWVSFPAIGARADDHFTGLAQSPDGMSCFALMMTNPGIVGGGLGRLWRLDGATATLEVRGLSLSVAGLGNVPGLLVRTENTSTGTNDLYAIGAAGVMVTSKPLPDEFLLERVSLTSDWQSVGSAGIAMQIPTGEPVPSSSPMIATWREEQDAGSFFASASGNWNPLSSRRWTIRQDQTSTGFTPIPAVDLRFQLEQPASLLESLGGNLRLLRNEGNGWNEITAQTAPTAQLISTNGVSGFSTWAAAFTLALEIETLPGNQVRLWWPAPADQQTLEQSGDLGVDGWQSVGVPGTLNGDRREITLTRSQARQFFRLRRSINPISR